MNAKRIRFPKRITALLCCVACVVLTFAADPIITIRSDAFKETGESNAFGLKLAASELSNYYVDSGFGRKQMQARPWKVSEGAIDAAYMSVTVSEEGIIRIYGDASKLTLIDVEGGYVTDVKMPDCTNLEIVGFPHNNLQSLDLTPFTKLQAIYLSDNPFTEQTPLIVGAPKPDLTIMELDIIDHIDQNFNLSDYPALLTFDGYHNRGLKKLDPTGCPNLVLLSVELTDVETLDVSKFLRLHADLLPAST